jgi:hypothetical protein
MRLLTSTAAPTRRTTVHLGAALLIVTAVACLRLAPSRPAVAAGTLHTLNLIDNGTTLSIPVGDSVELRLPATFNWSVTVSNMAVLRRPPVALVQGVQGLWDAVASGQVRIDATGTPNCTPGVPCPQLAAIFSATVVVSGAAADPAVYPAGWNIVGGPTGSSFPVTLYGWDSEHQQYATLSPGTPIQGGRGYWAYFNTPVSISLAPGVEPPSQPLLPGGRWSMVGNPFSDQCAGINVGPPDPGAASHDPNILAADTYDPVAGRYTQSSSAVLLPGRGASLLLQASAPLPLVPLGPPGPNGACIAPP